jgi:hypothetical protein
MMDDIPGSKIIYINNNIDNCVLKTYGNNITKLRFNKSMTSIPDKCMYTVTKNLTELNFNDATIKTISANAFGTGNTIQTLLNEIDIPITTETIG